MTGVLRKRFAGTVKAVGDGRVEAVMSTETKDRDGDIVRQHGWDLDNFLKRPVMIADHIYDLQHQIGRWDDVGVVEGKAGGVSQLVGTATYFVGEGNQNADWAFNLAKRGEAAFSVGFIPDMSKAVELEEKGMFPTFEFNGQELLETSQVVVPSNPDGLQRGESQREVWAKSLGEQIAGTIELTDGEPFEINIDNPVVRDLEARIAQLEQRDSTNNIEAIIERLKAMYPKLFEVAPESIQEVIAGW